MDAIAVAVAADNFPHAGTALRAAQRNCAVAHLALNVSDALELRVDAEVVPHGVFPGFVLWNQKHGVGTVWDIREEMSIAPSPISSRNEAEI